MSLLSFLSETISSGIKTGMLWERIGALSAGCADALQYGTVLFSFYRLFCGLLVVASVYDDPYRLRRAFFPVLLL